MYVLISKNQNAEYISDNDIVRKGSNDFICCPYHDDSDPSLSLDLENNCFHCFGCKESGVVLDADEYEQQKLERKMTSEPFTNVEFAEWGDDDWLGETEQPSEEPQGCSMEGKTVVGQREHLYTDEQGSPVKKKHIVKYADGSKDVRQEFYDHTNNSWVRSIPKDSNGNSLVKEVPYNLQSILDSDKGVILVEGEKDVDTLKSLGVATAITLGSSSDKLKPEHFKYFRDKSVTIFPDEDEVGYKYARQIAKTLFLNQITDRITFCFMPHQEDGKGLDVSDYLKSNPMSAEQFRDVAAENLTSFDKAQGKLSKYDGEAILTFSELISGYKDFPADEMPKVVRDYIKIKSSMDNTNLEYHCLGALAAFGSLAAGKYELQTFDKWKSNTAVNIALVGTTGQSKSHPLRESLSKIVEYNRIQNKKYEDEKKQYEKCVNNRRKNQKTASYEVEDMDKPVYQPYMLNKFTMEGLRDSLADNPKGVLLYVDELRGLFNSLNQYKGKGDDVETLMLLIDGQDVNIKLASENYYIKKPRVSVVGTIQPEILKRCFDRETKDNGLAFRFLFCCPDKKAFKLKKLNDKNRNACNKATDSLDRLFDAINSESLIFNDNGTVEPRKIYFDDDAESMFFDFVNEYCPRLEKLYGGKYSMVEGILAKIKTYYPKLALLIHLIRYYSSETEQLTIDANSVKISERLVKYFICHNYLALNTTGDDGLEVYLNKIKDYATRKGLKSLTVRDIVSSKILGRDKNANAVKKIVEQLSKLGKITARKEGKSLMIDLVDC